MRIHFFEILIILAFTLSACNRKGFTEITERDQFGMAFGEMDESDWQIGSEKFPRKIRKALDGIDCETQTTELGGANSVIAYPNPVRDNFTLYFDVTNSNVKVIIANYTSKILYEDCLFLDQPQNLTFSTDDLDLKSGKHYRVYYEITPSTGSLSFEGHGDLLME